MKPLKPVITELYAEILSQLSGWPMVMVMANGEWLMATESAGHEAISHLAISHSPRIHIRQADHFLDRQGFRSAGRVDPCARQRGVRRQPLRSRIRPERVGEGLPPAGEHRLSHPLDHRLVVG